MEFFVCSLAPYPFLKGISITEYNSDFDVDAEYEINHYFATFSCLRFYLLLRICLTLSLYMSARSYRIGALNGCVIT